MAYRFEAELWRYTGEAAWHFLTLPGEVADDIRARTQRSGRRGFGSVRVSASTGATTWTTSIFPDSKAGSFVLPVKKQVRDAERLSDGDLVAVELRVVGT